MRWLIDADLPRSVSDTLRRHGHEPLDVRDIGLGSATDDVIAHRAQVEQLCLLTGDYDFSDIRSYPRQAFSGIVVLSIPPTATATYINQLLDSFLQQADLVAKLPGSLAIVEPGRVRFRS